MKEHQQELNALLQLLDDPDEEVYRHVTDKLIAYGTSIIPSLESEWEKTFDPNLHYRLEELIHIIQFETLLNAFAEWKKDGDDDLLTAAILVSKYQYPDLNQQKIRDHIDRLTRDIWVEMNYDLTPIEQVNVFNHMLFTIGGFAGNTQNIHDPQNSYLNILLETKRGNPVSLGILYLILAEKIQMPVYGVNLPQHFILSFHKDLLSVEEDAQNIRRSVLFYINPLNKGVIFSRDDISAYLKKLNIAPEPEHYQPCLNKEIIIVLLNTLIVSYEISGLNEKVNELTRIREILQM